MQCSSDLQNKFKKKKKKGYFCRHFAVRHSRKLMVIIWLYINGAEFYHISAIKNISLKTQVKTAQRQFKHTA